MTLQRSTNRKDERPAVVFPASNTSEHGIHPVKDQKLHLSLELPLIFTAHTQVTNISVYVPCMGNVFGKGSGPREDEWRPRCLQGTSWSRILAICSCMLWYKNSWREFCLQEHMLPLENALQNTTVQEKRMATQKMGKTGNLDRIVAPLVEHLSPISTSAFLRVYVLVIFMAARDAKMKIKHWISKDTRGWKRGYKSRSQKKRPSSTKAQKADTWQGPRLTSECRNS